MHLHIQFKILFYILSHTTISLNLNRVVCIHYWTKCRYMQCFCYWLMMCLNNNENWIHSTKEATVSDEYNTGWLLYGLLSLTLFKIRQIIDWYSFWLRHRDTYTTYFRCHTYLNYLSKNQIISALLLLHQISPLLGKEIKFNEIYRILRSKPTCKLFSGDVWSFWINII